MPGELAQEESDLHAIRIKAHFDKKNSNNMSVVNHG
jgi:hypothetical protein